MGDLTETRRPVVAPERDSADLKKDLINMAVHDMRNAVTSTILRLDMIESDPESRLTSNQGELLQMAKWNLFKLSGMTTNLLEISRFESDSIQVRRNDVNVIAFIDGVVKVYTAAAEMERMTIEVSVDPGAASIVCDPYLLGRILSNILSNAIRHSYSVGKILIRALATEAEGAVLFRIQDFGEGIPAEYHEKIFEKFFRVEMKRLGSKSNTGLGLAFCRMAVEAMGGGIWVESKSGEGSCFTFFLPGALVID